MGQLAEGVGVAFEGDKVAPLFRLNLAFQCFAFAILGSYAIKKSMFDVGTCLAFGLVGWMFKKYKYPASPLVLGIILGKLIETNYVQTLMVTGPVGFVQRPLTVILFVISIVALAYPVISDKVKEKKLNNSRQ